MRRVDLTVAIGVGATLSGLGILGWLVLPVAAWGVMVLYQMNINWAVVMGLVATGVAALAIAYQRRVRWPTSKPGTGHKAEPTMNNLEQYKNWCTQQIARLVMEQQVHVQASVQRGPFTLTYTLRVTQDPVLGLRKLLGLGSTLQMVLQTNVRIQQSPQGVLVEVELPATAHLTPNAVKLARACRWPQIPIGLDQWMKPISVNPETHGALYWVAPPRAGKTQSIRSTLYLICRSVYDVRFLVCALPAKIQKDWGIFAGVNGCLGMVSDFAEMEEALRWAVTQMNTGAYGGTTIIILDDLTSLMTQAPAISSHIDNLALTGPGLGYHLMCGTHGAGSIATTGGKMAQFAMTCRILFKAADNLTGARSSGRKNAETGLGQLSGAPGDAILDENGRITRVATAWVRDADIMMLPAAAAPPSRPWRGVVTNHEVSQPVTPGMSRGMTSGNGTMSRLSQPVTDPHPTAPAVATRGGVRDDVTKRDIVTRDSLLAELAKQRPGLFPINPERPLNATEDGWLRWLFDSGLFSESALADVVYGQRNKRRLAYVRAALARTLSWSDLPSCDDEEPLTERQAIEILEGNPAHPRRAEALAYFNLSKEELYEDA